MTSISKGCGDVEETIDNVGARGKYPPMGYYSAKAVDELYALGVDPVAPEQTRQVWLCHPRPEVAYPGLPSDATEVTDQAGSSARFADANCGAGIRPDQAGPGSAVPV